MASRLEADVLGEVRGMSLGHAMNNENSVFEGPFVKTPNFSGLLVPGGLWSQASKVSEMV